MKTAFFLNTFVKMSNYDLENLVQPDIQFVAITSKEEFNKFREKYNKYFVRIYQSPEVELGSLEKINYEFAKNIVSEEIKKSNSVHIIAQSEDNLLLAGMLRDQFSLEGMSFQKTLLFRDKVIMKEALKKNKIRIPKFKKFTLNSAKTMKEQFFDLKEEFGLPFVLKPTRLLGGVGVSIIDNEEIFSNIVSNTQEYCEYEVEEYISGTLYHCDTIRKNKESLFQACCEYSNPNVEFQVGKPVISLPLKHDSVLAKRIFEFNEEVLKALDFETGTTHHEFFVTSWGEIIFLEIAARSPGAIITPMYRKVYNIGFEDAGFKLEMNIPFQLKPIYGPHFLSGILPVIPGIVKSLREPVIQSKYHLNWAVKPGDKLAICSGLRDKSAAIEVWNDDYDVLVQDFKTLQNYQCIEMF